MNAQDLSNLTLALRLAEGGIPVFPCLEKEGRTKKEKAPYTASGFKDATTDANVIAGWWAQWPQAIPGIPTGDVSGISVIDGDINRDTGEALGEAEIDRLGLQHPEAVKVRTQSGGVQYLFRHVEGAGTSSKQVDYNIDTRGAGGYIIAPGARMASGAVYQYEGRSLSAALAAGDLPPYPVEAVNAAIAAHKERKKQPQGTAAVGDMFNFNIDTDSQWGGQSDATEAETLDAVRGLLAEAPNALCREDWVKLAASLRSFAGGALQEDFIAFSQRYIGGATCTREAALHVWGSVSDAKAVKGIGSALWLLKDAVSEARYKEIWRDVFGRSRPDGTPPVAVSGQPVGSDQHGNPEPLLREIPDAAPYPVEALGVLRTAAEAVATATEGPIAMCAASVLAAAALASQGLRDAETLSGSAPASLFLLTIAESGERKSSADRLAMRGVRAFESNLGICHEADAEAHAIALELWKVQHAKILADKKSDAASKRDELKALGPKPLPPIRPYVVVGSPTIEGIVKFLPELRPSLGIMTEEGGALIGGHSMKSENRLATCAALSAMWDGAPLDRWRAGEGVAVYKGRRFSAHLLVQPVAAETLLADPMANGQGLLARFLTCRPPSNIGKRLRMTRDPAAEAEIAAFARRVDAVMGADLPLAEGKRNELEPPLLPLSHEARAVLTDFNRDVERAQLAGGDLEGARAFASKTAEHAARIAAVLTIFENPNAAKVSGEVMANAVTLAAYYASEAARLLEAAIVPPEIADAETMRKWLVQSWKEEHISASTAAQYGPFKVTARARKALQALQGYGWLIPVPGALVLGKQRKEAWRVIREVSE